MAAAKPVIVNGDKPMSDRNPHSWLVLNGDPAEAEGPRVMTGTMRPEHRGRSNFAAAFAAAKLLIEVGDADAPWVSGAYRHEVLLPRDADDRFMCPKTLFTAVESAHVSSGKSLVGYITLTWTPARLHHGWHIARTLAAGLVDEHRVPALIVQHVPGLVASTAQPHCHILLAGPRMLTGLGWGGYVAALTGDRLWPLVRARFDALISTS